MLEGRIYKSGAEFHALESYDRRNNLEFEGIPSSIDDNFLEKTIVDVCNSIGVKISEDDIEDCHRLGKNNPKKVITRFVYRKNCKLIIKNKRMLKTTDKSKLGFPDGTNIFVNEKKSPFFNHLSSDVVCYKEPKRSTLIPFVILNYCCKHLIMQFS